MVPNQRLMMELEGGHRNSVIKRRNPIEFGLVFNDAKEKPVWYRLSAAYSVNSTDGMFRVCFVRSGPIEPGNRAAIKVSFRPTVPEQSFADHYIVDDTAGNSYLLTLMGKCKGPKVYLNRNKIVFSIHKNRNEQRKRDIRIINDSTVDTTYQWLLTGNGIGDFQISSETCGAIKAFESINFGITFNGIALGVHMEEFVCLVLNQEPLYLKVIATVLLSDDQSFDHRAHVFERSLGREYAYYPLMNNSLEHLKSVPIASVYDRYLDFGLGSTTDVTKNISQTLCVTNHGEVEGYMQWTPDPDNIFLVDPIALIIPPKESTLFTVRFRPKFNDRSFSYLMCGEYQQKVTDDDNKVKIKHQWFRLRVGILLGPCADLRAECGSSSSNGAGASGFYKFYINEQTRHAHEFQISSTDWNVGITFSGKAELGQVEFMSHGYNPATDAMYEFNPTVTGCVSHTIAYVHNQTRMPVHMRILNYVPWLGADDCGSIVLPPREVVQYRLWFFPDRPDQVYETVFTCSCVCLIDDKPVGGVTDLLVHVMGFSERAHLKTLPKSKNLLDVVVGEKVNFKFLLYNFCACEFTSTLFSTRIGMGDDHSKDVFEMESKTNALGPSSYCEVKCSVTPHGAGARQISIRFNVFYLNEHDQQIQFSPIHRAVFTLWYDGIYSTMQIKRTLATKCPMIFSNHCLWNSMNIKDLNKALEECRPKVPQTVELYAPDLYVGCGIVELTLVLGCVYAAPVEWRLRRRKLCDCQMVEVQIGTSLYEMRHDACPHRRLVELNPSEGIVTKDEPVLLCLEVNYSLEGKNTLCYELKMSHDRTLFINIHILAHKNLRGVLTALRRCVEMPQYLAVMDCGRVPINNLDPVIRIVWLYNPTATSVTWRLLQGARTDTGPLRCLLHFAAVSSLEKLAIPFSFLPTEMIDYEAEFYCTFGSQTLRMLVKGQGGLPNCWETRLDVPRYMEKLYRSACRRQVVYLSVEHITVPELTTHSLWRDLLAINNDTDHVMRFIWLPERVANMVNIVMSPCWGVVMPKSAQWVTVTVYTLQEPVTFTTTVACEILDLTLRKQYRQNEMLRKQKTEQYKQEFIITEKGTFYKDINDCPPYVLDLKKPQPSHLALSVAISSKGQRDGYTRMNINKMWEQTPPYDLLFTEINDTFKSEHSVAANNLAKTDVLRIIDNILW
ncbi:Cilia- and flagella-associated protein 65 [Eumeta japonica]|uniref:Cilia-and flagella-associated protein 65 n=1 Tax=Eumeta variegata TaxID=151549 RepID=A0A4C1VVP6_EUMVA|nr:Cilia- and flagella-associated protein 65 [Eumeta japonica]